MKAARTSGFERRTSQKVETEKEGIKAVVTQIAQGHAQHIGAVKQKTSDLENGMRELREGTNLVLPALLSRPPEASKDSSKPKERCRKSSRATSKDGRNGKMKWKTIATW